MDYLRELVSECSELRTAPVLTETELSYIEEGIALIDALEMPLTNEEDIKLDPNKEIKPDEIKKNFLKSVMGVFSSIKKKPELVSKIAKKAADLKKAGITDVKEMYNNIMKDTTFLKPVLTVAAEYFKTTGVGWAIGAGATLIVITSTIIIILLATMNPLMALKIIITKLLPQMTKLALKSGLKGLIFSTAYAAGGAIGKTMTDGGGFKNVFNDLINVIKQFNIKNLKNKFRDYEVMPDNTPPTDDDNDKRGRLIGGKKVN